MRNKSQKKIRDPAGIGTQDLNSSQTLLASSHLDPWQRSGRRWGSGWIQTLVVDESNNAQPMCTLAWGSKFDLLFGRVFFWSTSTRTLFGKKLRLIAWLSSFEVRGLKDKKVSAPSQYCWLFDFCSSVTSTFVKMSIALLIHAKGNDCGELADKAIKTDERNSYLRKCLLL